MSKLVQITVMVIYIVTSSFTIGVNKWTSEYCQNDQSYAEILFELLTFPICDSTNEGNDIPVLIKDPTDEGSMHCENCYIIVSCEFTSIYNQAYSKDKINGPFLNIYSPPPQLI